MAKGKSNWRCVLGLTGGMGSGKSTVLSMFKEKGAYTLDSDAIVRRLLANDKKVLGAIRKKFGPTVFSGTKLDRTALAARVFSSTMNRKALERLLHPLVKKEILTGLAKKSGKVAVVDVPLLFESGWGRRFDRIVVVDASMKKRLKRLEVRGFKAMDVRKRLKAQWPLNRKVRLADFVVNNNGPKAQTKKQIDQIWKTVTGGL